MSIKRVYFVGVGGQGNILSAKILGSAAILENLKVAITETHGMAQRGGVVESSVVIGGESPTISVGEADILVAFEPMEALRSLKKANENSLLLTSIAKIPPFTVGIGGGDYPSIAAITQMLKSKVRRFFSFDALEIAKKQGNVLGSNMVMLGALAGTGEIPVSEKSLKHIIRAETRTAFVESNLRCFESGFQFVRQAQ